jgi:CS domain
MPVTPKYEWNQTERLVEIKVLVPSITRQKPDVFGTSALVKVVAHPYFLQLDLAHDVNFAKGVATVKSGFVRFTLPKAEAQHWDTLLHTGPEDVVKRRRDASISEAQEALERQREARKTRLQEQKKCETIPARTAATTAHSPPRHAPTDRCAPALASALKLSSQCNDSAERIYCTLQGRH